MWRKQNLATLRTAKHAKQHSDGIYREKYRAAFPFDNPFPNPFANPDATPEALEEISRAAKRQALKELGKSYDLVDLGDAATFDGLSEDMAIDERFGTMIDRHIKRLLHLRGLKSLSMASALVSPQQLTIGAPRAA